MGFFPLSAVRTFFEARSRLFVVAFCLTMIAAIWIADYLSPLRASLLIFYLIPVLVAAWFAGLWPAVLVGLAADAGWLISDVLMAGTGTPVAFHLQNFAVRLSIFCLLAYLESSRERSMRRERELSRTDSLTGVENSRAFREKAALEIMRVERTRRPLTLAYLDLDGFKELNDDRGHSAGDGILCAVAGVLRANMRATDTVARIGGDEFVIMLPESDRSEAERALSRIRRDLAFIAAKAGWPVGISVGAVTFDEPPASVDELLREADRAMYAAKREGKDRTHFSVPPP